MKDQMNTIDEDKEKMIPLQCYKIMGVKVDVRFFDGSETFETRLRQFEEMMKLSE